MAHTRQKIAGKEVVVIQDAIIGYPQDSTLIYIANRIASGDTKGELIEGRWYVVENDQIGASYR